MANDDDDDEEDHDNGAEEANKRFKMIDARLRRLCERKKNGQCKVPELLHSMWSKGGQDRDKLRVLFEQLDLDKALPIAAAFQLLNPQTVCNWMLTYPSAWEYPLNGWSFHTSSWFSTGFFT